MRRGKRVRTEIEQLESRQLLSALPTPDHIVVVVEENKDYGEVIGSTNAPYINSLAAGGANFTNAFAETHPSEPNYLALFSGSTQGVTTDDIPKSLFAGPDLGSALSAAGFGFAGYSEDLPAVGSLVETSGAYARKHNPWSDFADVPATENLPFTAFPTDFTQLPTVSIVVPNLNDDMHDGTVAQADKWLQTNLGAYASWAQSHNSLLIVTCDENDGSDPSNRIPTIFYGQGIQPGAYTLSINHYSMLRTIEDMYGLQQVGASATATAIQGIWSNGAAPTTSYLSDLQWTSATVGYGTIHKDANINGQLITLRGTVYPKGIGTHAVSQIVYNLGGQYASFSTDVGVDDDVIAQGGTGSVDFQILGDGKMLYDSGVLTSKSAVAHVNVSVAGVQQLTLIAKNGVANSIDYDHADWAGALLTAMSSSPTAPTAPANLTANAISSSQIALSWTNTAANQSGFQIERSTDATNFITLTIPGLTATTYIDSGLAAGATYYYRVEAINAVGASPLSNVANATTLAANLLTTNLSGLTWTSATIGYGTIHKDASVNGNTLTLNGVTYSKGIGTHAVSQINYQLAGKYTNFLSDVGIDDEVGANGSVDFKVMGDGKLLFDSGVMTGSSATVGIGISVAGVQQLSLIATNGVSGIDYDHADWAGARLLSVPGAPTAPSAPTSLTATVVSTSQISLRWTNTAANQSGFQVERSLNGVAFTPVAVLAASATAYNDTGLSASTKYYYRVEATNSVGASPPSNIASATTRTSVSTYLSDLNWVSATTGLGTVQKNASVKGKPIMLRGTKYAKGIGTHADSTIVYNLAGKYSTFQSDIGIDDLENGLGSVTFQVIGDGQVLYASGTITGASPVVHINVSVAGVQQLQLVVTTATPGNIDYDQADWANAVLMT